MATTCNSQYLNICTTRLLVAVSANIALYFQFFVSVLHEFNNYFQQAKNSRNDLVRCGIKKCQLWEMLCVHVVSKLLSACNILSFIQCQWGMYTHIIVTIQYVPVILGILGYFSIQRSRFAQVCLYIG